jgi:flagellar motility protein MotE (MotC chaperone)
MIPIARLEQLFMELHTPPTPATTETTPRSVTQKIETQIYTLLDNLAESIGSLHHRIKTDLKDSARLEQEYKDFTAYRKKLADTLAKQR